MQNLPDPFVFLHAYCGFAAGNALHHSLRNSSSTMDNQIYALLHLSTTMMALCHFTPLKDLFVGNHGIMRY